MQLSVAQALSRNFREPVANFDSIIKESNNMFTIEIPCKRYVKHYLENRYGNPVRLTEKSNIGKYFTRILEKNHTGQDHKSKDYPCLTVVVCEKIAMKEGFTLSPSSVTAFNNFVADTFKAEAHLIIDSLVEVSGMKKAKAYQYIYDYFSMNEDVYSLECLKKNYQRYAETRKSLVFSE